MNRFDLPYRTITGLVDNDRYHDVFTHIPAVWIDPDFTGTLPAGTPIAQCVPIRRQTLELETAAMTPEELRVFLDATQSINENPGEYKRLYRVARLRAADDGLANGLTSSSFQRQADAAYLRQIGRASLRDRVGPYLLIQV